tara:strand:- start:60 stop:719 length:660 start_codon:yes stop_codon:yes gene_type:complete
MSHNYVVKLILLGDPGTGKTSLLHRFIDSAFLEKHETTIGVDFQAKTVFSSSGNLLRLHLWDTAGQEHFRSIVSAYYRCIAAALIVYDVTNRESFENLDHWLTELREKNSSLKELPIIILGNKTDEEDRKVSFEEAYNYAKKHNVRYSDISVKKNIGVDEAILRIVDDVDDVFIKNNVACAGIKQRAQTGIGKKIELNQFNPFKNQSNSSNKLNCCIQS